MQLDWKAVFMILKAKIQDQRIYVTVGKKFQRKNKTSISLYKLWPIFTQRRKNLIKIFNKQTSDYGKGNWKLEFPKLIMCKRFFLQRKDGLHFRSLTAYNARGRWINYYKAMLTILSFRQNHYKLYVTIGTLCKRTFCKSFKRCL